MSNDDPGRPVVPEGVLQGIRDIREGNTADKDDLEKVLKQSRARPQVYLAGPRSDGDNPHAWHEQIQRQDEEIEWINPFTIHSEDATEDEIYENDVSAVLSSDAVLLRRIDDYEVCGAYIEAGFAGAAGIPTVVWNEAGSTVPEFLRWHADVICGSVDDAIQEVTTRV